MFRFRNFNQRVLAGLGAIALLSACTVPAATAVPAPPVPVATAVSAASSTEAVVEPTAVVASTATPVPEPAATPTESPTVAVTDTAAVTETSVVTETAGVNPFNVSVAQMFMDTAGFHGMAETLSDTRKIDTAYLSTVNRVTKVLTQTAWPAEFNDEAQTFIGSLNTFAAALTAGDVEAAVEASDVVHDAQHDLSHHIDEWAATGPARAQEVNPFDVSVAQMFMDTAGFHGMAETLSDTRKIDTAYLSTVNRVTKVLTQTTWPTALSEEAQAFIGSLDTFAAALTAGDVEAAVEASDGVHDAQHELSHHIDAWINPEAAKE
jgi:hypothetical protein